MDLHAGMEVGGPIWAEYNGIWRIPSTGFKGRLPLAEAGFPFLDEICLGLACTEEIVRHNMTTTGFCSKFVPPNAGKRSGR